MTLWGGVFEGGGAARAPLFRRFNDSLRYDRALLAQDITGSIAWAGALHRAGILDHDECARLTSALEELARAVAADPDFAPDAEDEDVHSLVERLLVERLGPLGKKLHTGRSRNDQVSTDLRLWCREEIDTRIGEIRAVQASIIAAAERHRHAILPGYTHLQRAQPVLFAHWCLAYVEMLERDAERLADARSRLNLCPLGAAALAGTAYPIDREQIARDLGFDGITPNSLDTVSDRDFVLETLSALATIGVHLSRCAEDLIIYATGEFAFVSMDESVTTGSSIMPQKRNPDALELIRGKAGRVIGAWVSLATTLKGLPLAYNKDMQEDKEPLFDAMETTSMCLGIMAIVFSGLTMHEERTRHAAMLGYANATDLADYLVGKGVPFRDAHEFSGRAVRLAQSRSVAIEELPIADLRVIAPEIEPDIYDRISLDAVLARRDVPGGTAPARVHAALVAAKERIEAAAQGGVPRA